MKIWRCHDSACGWFGPESDALTARHPFVDDEEVYGCPWCMELSLELACDEPGCGQPATGGTPVSPTLYRHTCDDHRSQEQPPKP